MSYWVDIIDTLSTSSSVEYKKAQQSSIVLSWNGSDDKDDLTVVGSSLKFSLWSENGSDGTYKELFTGNETRYKIELKKSSDNAVIWSGFLLPDLYNEPYKNVNFFVDFQATDGLGRLKGKYLPDDYYKWEKSLIDIFCKVLSLTGLELDLYFCPAIENSLNKNWNTIYIDTETFVDGKKKLDAYAILETLLQDTLCVCFQADNRWYIEGINQRILRKVIYKKYNYLGVFQEEVGNLKLLKSVKPSPVPNISTVPQYNTITVSHKRVPQDFPKTIAKEANDGWVVTSSVIGSIYATDWNGNNGYYCKCVEPNYYNSVKKEYIDPNLGGQSAFYPYDPEKFVNLKTKIFVYKFQKLNISAEFRIIKWVPVLSDVLESSFHNPLKYEISLNGVVLFSNNRSGSILEKENLVFENDTAKFNFDFIAQEDGLLDVKLWRPTGDVLDTNCVGFEIIDLKLEPVAFEEELIITDLITDDFTLDKEIELTYADDNSGFSKAFRLDKLKEVTDYYNTVEIPVLYRFQQNGNYYSVVNLDGANLIKDNINTVYHDGDLLENLEVIYNYFSGEQMVVKTNFETTHSFFVNIYKTNDVLGNREYWHQWTDSVYKVESQRYAKVVANIIRRMFNVVSQKIEMTVLNAVKFNDLILFKYMLENNYVVTNCSWDLDKNKTSLVISKAIYRDSGDTGDDPENIPPIVNAGPDIILEDAETTASFAATAYDVDGFIIAQNWTKVSGDAGDVIDAPGQMNTNVAGLTGDEYEYQIQVVDNDGASAVDTLRIIRRKDYEILMALDYLTGNSSTPYVAFQYIFSIDPEIAANWNLLITGKFFLNPYLQFGTDYSRARIIKNGVVIFEATRSFQQTEPERPFTIGYVAGDVIEFEVIEQGELAISQFGSSSIYIQEVEFVTGIGNIINALPVIAQPIPWP
jgi:hypothetical protein